jgi:1-deoxy-D-xylulose-5-phosphate reductoisomerase
MSKSISILGSTGSIGLSTLELLSKKKFSFKINILSANKNYFLICKQILKFKPKVFIVDDYFVYLKVKKKFKKKNIKIINRINDQKNIFSKSDITVSAIQGIAGLIPTIELIKRSKKILIANKESIICGWNLIQKIAKKYNTKIIPVDSEHFSIMKLLENKKTTNIKKIYLTASGGPFLNYKIDKLKKATPKEAIKHPKWNMGKRISINSATLMNKMLELIEAKKLFSIDLKKIEIVIHPESLVHAIVEFKNGLHEFIYHETTMLIPLANAIFGNDVNIENFLKPKTNTQNSTLSQNLRFLKVEQKRFPIIKLKHRINEHISTPIIINAANEILVDQYLKEKISFDTFYKYLLQVLNDRNYKKYAIKEPKNVNQIFLIDKWSRDTVYKKIYYKNA